MYNIPKDSLLKYISSCYDDGIEMPHKLRARVSFAVIEHFLGKDWFDKHIGLKLVENNPTRNFLRTDKSEGDDGYLFQFRIERLANFLLNLSQTRGFNLVIDRIKSGDLEPIYNELDCACFFKRRALDFEFVKPLGSKGDDFDILIHDRNKKIPCEIKSKIEATSISKNTIVRSLKKARIQLPDDTLSLIIITIPENWISDESLDSIIDDSVNEFMRSTLRVLTVVVCWKEHFKFELGFQTLSKYKVFENNYLKNNVLKKYKVNQMLANTYSNQWVYISEQINCFLKNKGMSALVNDNSVNVKIMLEFLSQQNYDNIADSGLVSAVTILTELLLENKLQLAWNDAGNTNILSLNALNLKALCEMFPKKKIRFASAGGAKYKGIQVMSPMYYAGSFTEDEQKLFNSNRPKSVSTPVYEYLNDFCIIIEGHCITRRELLKYLSSRFLGFDLKGRSEKLENSKTFRLLDNQVLTIKIADKDAIFFELLAMIQVIVNNKNVKEIINAT